MKKSNITYKTGFFRNLTTNRYTIYDTSELTKEHYQKLSSITKDNIPEEIEDNSDHYEESIDSDGNTNRWISFKAIVDIVNEPEIVSKNKLQYLVKRQIFNIQDKTAVKITNQNSQPMWLINLDAFIEYQENRDDIEDNVTLDRIKKIDKDNIAVFAQLGHELIK